MIITAISGASGPIMGIRLIEELLNASEEVSVIVSETAWQIIEHELSYKKGASPSLEGLLKERGVARDMDRLRIFDNKDFFCPSASGSAPFEAVVVMPCSMKTLAGIAHGFADTLITRTCDVALKEKRRCVIVPRETPLNLIHVENMHKAALAGVEIVPPVPGFYTHPKSIDDVVNFVVGKVLSLLGREHDLFKSWGET